MRVVIDTNVWIEFLIGQRIQELKDLIIKNQVQVYFSPELLSELSTVLYRPKFRKYFSTEQVDEYILLLLTY